MGLTEVEYDQLRDVRKVLLRTSVALLASYSYIVS